MEEYVDLGLPSGKKWAKCNIGATKETESGLYFQWGDTVGRTAEEIKDKPCIWNTTPFGKNIDKIKDMVCPNDTLSKEYDAVYIHTHGKAHTPTNKDFKELVNNTTHEWVTNFNGSGVNGYKFTSKKDSSKYIFILAAGYTSGDSLYYQGTFGYVWSSSLYTSNPRSAYDLGFYSSDVYPSCYDNRYYGFSVRGIMD